MRRVRTAIHPPILATVKAATAFFALAVPGISHAGLDLTSPENVDLTGVWTIDPDRSDDPEEALASVRQQAKDRKPGRVSVGGGIGGIFGGTGGLGGRQRGNPDDREAKRERMQQMLAASGRIEFMQLPASVELNLDDRSVSCTSTAKSQVSMPNGELADRSCGWDEDEFVVELRGPEGFQRTDRYSRGDDRTLLVQTTVKSGRMPELSLKSVYLRSEPD